jgi:threonine/homoserine/homoserine lactone efflux protein
MDAFIFFTFAYFAAAGAPGADTMLIVSRTIVGGRASAWMYALGIAFAKAVMITLAFFGAGALLSNNPEFFVILKTLGAGFLLFMAVRLWLKPANAEQTQQTENKDVSAAASVLGGFAVSISNPQPLLFYSSIVPIVVAKGLNTINDLLILFVIVFSGFALITAFYMTLAMTIKKWLASGKNQAMLNKTMAAVFVILAAVIALR